MTTDPNYVARLKAMGFAVPSTTLQRRLIVSTSGMEKSGKTHFALSGPQPIIYMNLDKENNPAITTYAQARGIEIYEQSFYVTRGGANPASLQAANLPVWNAFKAAITEAWQVGKGTVVVDTDTQLYALLRLAFHGKISQIPPFTYGIMYAELEDLLNIKAYNSGMCGVFIDKMGPVFEGKGAMERKGYGNMPYLTQMNIQNMREEVPAVIDPITKQLITPAGSAFSIWIKDSSITPLLNNKRFQDPPGTPPEESKTSLEYVLSLLYDGVPIP